MITHIHHLNFLVKDLDQSTAQYQSLLGVEKEAFIYDELEGRAVRTARIKLGQTWLILVQPTSDQGIPAEHLQQYGEGFFLMSLNSDDLDQEQRRLATQTDHNFSTEERLGLDKWRVRDIDKRTCGGVQIQLTEDADIE